MKMARYGRRRSGRTTGDDQGGTPVRLGGVLEVFLRCGIFLLLGVEVATARSVEAMTQERGAPHLEKDSDLLR